MKIPVELRLKLMDIKTRYEEQITNIMNFTESVFNLINNKRKEVYEKSRLELDSEDTEDIENFRNLQRSIDRINDQTWQYMNMLAVNLIVLFEAFNKDFFLELYLYNPEMLKNKDKTLNYDKILDYKSIKDIIHQFAREKIDKFGRESIDWLKNQIKISFKLNITNDFSDWKCLRDFYYIRNDIVHNQSIMPERLDENLNPIDEDRKKYSLDLNSLKKYSNTIINYLNYIHKNIVYSEKNES